MILLTLCILSVGLIGCCNCSQLPFEASSSIIGDNVVIVCVLAVVGAISLLGACALCFRRKKTFEKLENEAGNLENAKKNEYPIFRALATEAVNESSAIVPCERNNLSRDNLLNSSDNLANNNGCSPRSDIVDSSDVVLIEKASTPSNHRDKVLAATARDTITYETEKDIKKHQSPSSSTPLLYANNVQSYQHAPTTVEQMQQKTSSVLLTTESPYKDFYDENLSKDNEELEIVVVDDKNRKELDIAQEANEESGINSNPFFNSANVDTIVEGQSVVAKGNKKIFYYLIAKKKKRNRYQHEVINNFKTLSDDGSEVESSVNDNSEKYQILDEETDGEEVKLEHEDEMKLTERRDSNSSIADNNSIEEALRALDIAIGLEDDEDEEEFEQGKIEEIKEEAKILVDSVVEDCEKILEKKTLQESSPIDIDNEFEEFSSLNAKFMSTPCASLQLRSSNVDSGKVKNLFPDDVDINNDTFDITQTGNKTFDMQPINDKTFDSPTVISEMPSIKIDKDETGSEDLTTVTPVNTPIELSYSSETWDKMTYNKGAISKKCQVESSNNKTVTLEGENETITFNQDGWYLHPQARPDAFNVDDEEDEEGNMEDMSSTYDQLRRQLKEMLPHAQGMSQHNNDFLDDDDDLNKDSSSPSENYGIKYGELDEASNAGTFDLLGALLNCEPTTSNEMHINYKRPLSPIMEESECDETCRTFVFNETKLLDSTSTGIMESASAEAQMGQIPKALMASNDTLFNFEDTLSDQTDNLMMSPRMQTAGSSASSTLSRQESHDKISLERTPTNEDPPMHFAGKCHELDPIDVMKNNIRQHPLNLDLTSPIPSTSKYEITVAKLTIDDGSWPLDLPEAQQIVNDLSSPDQNRADSLSFEQDMTYTIDDQKTCVSLVLKNDDERISEISEPIFASESLDLMADDDDDDDNNKVNSLQMDDIISIETDDNLNYEINDENGNQDCDTKDMEMTLNVQESSSVVFDNDSINPEGDEVSKKKEIEIDSLEIEKEEEFIDEIVADSIPASHASKSINSVDSINTTTSNNSDKVQSEKSSESDDAVIVATPIPSDSSDDSEGNDKKKILKAFARLCCCVKIVEDLGSSTDIRQVSCNQGMMTTSFTKEWSDDDSSHSSEEFMYVKGNVGGSKTKLYNDTSMDKPNEENEENNDTQHTSNDKSYDDVEDVEVVDINWQQTKDSIAATPNFHGDEPQFSNESEDESCEEGEFIPSSWNQSLQPKRSSLKSPEKEKVLEEPKKSRRVAFKIQRYHSVYEYPCEVVQLSPAYSEPQLWSNYMDDCSGNIDFFTYAHQLSDVASNFPQQIDGFTITSSSRPFHNSNQVHLHNTWPNDSTDFSWSQIQDVTDNEDSSKQHHQFPLKIEWPIRRNFDDEEFDERPDSGVGESSDVLTDPLSMGELCHTKGLLRLPLELVSSTSSEVSDFMSDLGTTKEEKAISIEVTNDDESPKQPKSLLDIDEDTSDKMILPTPSCTGSMDSLSSNSGSSNSERGPPSFTTFGKENITKEGEVSGRTSIVFIEDEVQLQTKEQKISEVLEKTSESDDKYILSNKLVLTVGSSDEDSGFENIRMAIK
ncbi:CLUMA_CG012169, isoform A [Clunio marinus]|uniref:CLUMA_CG012169, isoform A n=1 Tax=Clunio marinus TaxID=568069 RepID=A0A1J1IFN4_9DIPT|nr:CLUMA_CG012169, isoform A [Clunio marinus]